MVLGKTKRDGEVRKAEVREETHKIEAFVGFLAAGFMGTPHTEMILSKKENHMATLHMSAAEYRMYVAAESQKKGPKHRNHIVYVFADGFVSNSKVQFTRDYTG